LEKTDQWKASTGHPDQRSHLMLYILQVVLVVVAHSV